MQRNIKRILPILMACSSMSAVGLEQLSVSGDLTLDWSLVDGGVESGETLRGLANLYAEYDVSEWLEDGSINVGYAFYRGRPGWKLTGDFQWFGNIDQQNFSRWYEVYLGFSPWQGGRLKIGQLDANSDFGMPQMAAEFINSSMGVSPTVFTLPTYPRPVYAAVVQQQWRDDLVWKIGVYDGTGKQDDFDELFVINQLAWQVNQQLTASIGYWRHSGVATDTATQSTGDWYLMAEGQLNDSWTWFAQWGSAEPELAEIERHLGAGVECDSCLVESHIAGFGVTQAKLAGYQNETAYEAFYAVPIQPDWQIKADLQYIDKPYGDTGIDSATAFTLRLEGQF